MLEQATQCLAGYDNVEIRTEDAYHTSFADSSFSAVMAVNLLHHVNAPVTIAQECHRVLTSGGKVVLIDCAGHGTSLWSWIRTTLGNLLRRDRPPEAHRHFSPDELAVLITDTGFSVQETTVIRQRRPRMGFICLCAIKAD